MIPMVTLLAMLSSRRLPEFCKVGRLTDTIARWGGEEFILTLLETLGGRESAYLVPRESGRLFVSTRLKLAVAGAIDVTCSIGLSAVFSLDRPGLVSWKKSSMSPIKRYTQQSFRTRHVCGRLRQF